MNGASDAQQHAINTAVGDLDLWLDTMRSPRGYTGPPADWWQHGFTTMGPTLDWRYEGIIAGYLQLWRHTGNGHWLAKAQWAGDDLLAGQSPSGYFAHGAAGQSPASAAAPHAAGCAGALLHLASALREARSAVWQPYAAAAEVTIHGVILNNLWDVDRQVFREAPGAITFVPHQVATICEALFRQAELRRLAAPVETYVLPALQMLMRCQIQRPGHALDGAIPFRIVGFDSSGQFLPIAIARVIPALCQGYDWTGDARFLAAAWRAFAFVQRHRNTDGSFPAVVYPRQRVNQYPQWIAATGDVLRAASTLRERGVSTNIDPTWAWMLAGQDCTGGIATARGIGSRVLQRRKPLPDVRDLLHAVGWCDKAFRALAMEATDVTPSMSASSVERQCLFRGRVLTLCQDDNVVEIQRDRELRYRWRKGDDWPTICAPEFMLP